MDKHIDNIVSGIVGIMGEEAVVTDEATLRCVRKIVASWFNYTLWNNHGAIGFQVQQIMGMVMRDGHDGFYVTKLGAIIALAIAEQTTYKEESTREADLARQHRVDAYRLRARKNTLALAGGLPL